MDMSLRRRSGATAGLSSSASVPVLQKALKDEDWLGRWAAREAIEKLRSSR